ncbi:MAG: hypothetical protein HY868_02280 [Chloroflexi bacterium]|nr:hypothetical protein [Chloroflexota bacterium]
MKLSFSAWMLAVALTLGIFIAAIPARYAQLTTVTPLGDDPLVMLATTEAAFIQDAGWSVEQYALYFIALEVLFAAVFAALGALIVWRKRDQGLAQFASLTLITFGVLVPATLRAVDVPGSRLEWVVHAIQSLGWLAFMACLYLFPNGRFAPRWTRWLLAPFGVWAVAWVFVPAANPFNWSLAWMLIAFLGSFSTGVLAQMYRYVFVSSPLERAQTRWVVFAFALATLGILAFLAPTILSPATREPGSARVIYHMIGVPVFAFSLLLIPASIGIAILRYRLWDIDLLIRRTLIYGVLSAALLALYFGSVVALQQLFRAMTGEQSDVAIILSTLVIAGAFNPLRHVLQDAIDRRFYRRKYDAARVLDAFGATARDQVELNALTQHLLHVVEETIQPTSASLWLKSDRREKM